MPLHKEQLHPNPTPHLTQTHTHTHKNMHTLKHAHTHNRHTHTQTHPHPHPPASISTQPRSTATAHANTVTHANVHQYTRQCNCPTNTALHSTRAIICNCSFSPRSEISISNRYFADISTRGSSHRNAVISTQQQKVTRKPNHFHSVSSTYKMSSALTLTCHTGLRPSLNA